MSDSDVVIRVDGLGKRYALHHEKAERYTALRDVVARQAKAAGRLLNPFTLAGQLRKAQREAAAERAGSEEEFWALKDVSFEIRRGERVGIIGRNGAGKSTLLKILSRITEPTTGRVEIRGRVASLLEVGTGFHPELTGRENIYLNGAILGMTRREIRSKFDEIVAFAEVERFLDTPVKRYSSGMYVRLAFAVAAHLEPEILVVDEVLAVGDNNFQDKCLKAMKRNEYEKTVLFVSHNLSSIRDLCQGGLLLERGASTWFPSIRKAIETYHSETDQGLSSKHTNRFAAKAHSPACITSVKMKQDGRETPVIRNDMIAEIEIQIKKDAECKPVTAINLKTIDGIMVCDSSDEQCNETEGEKVTRRCLIRPYTLNEGTYCIDVFLGIRGRTLLDRIECAMRFRVCHAGLLAESTNASDWSGIVGPGFLEWQ